MIQSGMVKQILQIGAPGLSEKSKKVIEFNTLELNVVVTDLIDTADKNRLITAGLAAPQIGISLAVCVCRRVDLEKQDGENIPKEILWEVMINPVITKLSKGESVFWEGCLSVGIGNGALFGPVTRSKAITVKYQNITGEAKELTVQDFFSHEVQHEIDHLEGIIFLKYISNPANIWKRKDLDVYYDKNGEYPPEI